MKQELETLRAELHSITAKIDKLIKPMSLESLAEDMSYLTISNMKDYLQLNKTQIIETLNNL